MRWQEIAIDAPAVEMDGMLTIDTSLGFLSLPTPMQTFRKAIGTSTHGIDSAWLRGREFREVPAVVEMPGFGDRGPVISPLEIPRGTARSIADSMHL
jgi:hypothetical protein